VVNTIFNSATTFNLNTTHNNTRMVHDDFHPFPRLPTELRQEIWRLCLPHRVCEMDDPAAFIVYESYESDYKVPCGLLSTSRSNTRPPLLTRVCRESRGVAFATGTWYPYLDWRGAGWFAGPGEADWNTGNVIDKGFWQDPSRDSAHMNWTSSYDIDFGTTIYGHPLTSLAEEAKGLNGSASFMLDALEDGWDWKPYISNLTSLATNLPVSPGPLPIPPSGQNPAALKLLPEWMVIVKVVVIHLDLRRAAHSGLFGLSGDEVIQVVDAGSPLASRLYELAEDCERGASAITTPQDFTRMSANDMDAMVKREAFEALRDHEVGKRLRPAIMFRLCTRMCNHINTPKQEQTV
jgi:hypothetical protein